MEDTKDTTVITGTTPIKEELKVNAAPLFQVPFKSGELIPLKGIMFEVKGATKDGMVILAAKEFTKSFLKRVKR